MKTAIVILNWNGEKMLKRYLQSVVDYSSQDAQIIVADNASTDKSLEFLNNNFPQVKTIVLNENYGFAEGYNRALEQVDAEYYVLLNSDVEVTPDWLKPLINFMDTQSSVAACQPKLLSFYQKTHFEYAGAAGGFIDKYGYPFCRGRIFKEIEEDNAQYDEVCPVFWATGACLVIRSELFKRAGGFDKRFFAHSEEIDLCWRLHLMGHDIYCVPQSKVYHLGGGTLPQGNPRKTFLNFRNNLAMLYKNLSQDELQSVMRMRTILDFVAAMQMLLKGDVSSFKAIRNARKEFKNWKKKLDEDRKKIQSSAVKKQISERKNYFLLWQFHVKRRKTYSELPK